MEEMEQKKKRRRACLHIPLVKITLHSFSSSPDKEQSQVEVERKLLEALEIYPLVKLCGIHRHFVLFGLTEYLQRSFKRQFSPSVVLQLLDRFYNLEMLQPDDEETEILNQEEDFCLPQSFFVKEEPLDSTTIGGILVRQRRLVMFYLSLCTL